jgi:thiosulfate/3-mercaptopyruvate sulfurtransferase
MLIMNKTTLMRSLAVAGALVLLVAGAVAAQSARERTLVSTEWLAQHLNDPDLVLLHVGDKAGYDGGHVSGARQVDLNTDVSVSDHSGGGLMLEMPPADALRNTLAALGVSKTSRVVIYSARDSVQTTTRVFFTLHRAGLERIAILDGGLSAWAREGRPTTTAATPVRPGTLAPLAVRPLVVDAAFVQSHLKTPGFVVVDARAPAFYDGAQTGGAMGVSHKTGHIPGASNVPFSATLTSDLRLKPAAELQALFTAAGVKPGDTVIAYCHIGQQATLAMFAAQTLGYQVLLYDGSFEDWSLKDLPVEVTVKKGGVDAPTRPGYRIR